MPVQAIILTRGASNTPEDGATRPNPGPRPLAGGGSGTRNFHAQPAAGQGCADRDQESGR